MQRLVIVAIVLIGLALRIVYANTVSDIQGRLDYPEYEFAAAEVQRGDFTFSSKIFQLRPPVFPVLLAALEQHKPSIRLVNILISLMIIPLTYALARQLSLPQNMALVAATIVALDPTSVKYAGSLLAEPLASLTLAIAYIALAALRSARNRPAIVMLGALAGLCILLSALTRPSAYLFWIPMALWLVYARRSTEARLLAALALVLPAALGVGLWKYHNAVHYDNSSFTSVGAFNLLHHRAASVLYQATVKDIRAVHLDLVTRVESRLGNDTAGLTSYDHWNHRTGSAEQQSVMTEVALEVFLTYPLHYLLTLPVGLLRLLVEVAQWPWWIAVGWNTAMLVLSAVGLWRLLLKKRWSTMALLLLPCLYFVGGTLIVQTSSIDTRARVMVTPLLAIMAAHGILHLLNRRKAASASPSPPAGS